MSDKSDAIAVLETVRGETQDAINGIPEEKMTVAAFGTWSVKDVLCHLASWEQFAVPDLQRISRGHIPQLATLRLEEIDEWHTASPATILEELKASKDAYVTAARLLPEERFRESRTAYRLLQEGGIDHYRDHAAQIRDWRKREGI